MAILFRDGHADLVAFDLHHVCAEGSAGLWRTLGYYISSVIYDPPLSVAEDHAVVTRALDEVVLCKNGAVSIVVGVFGPDEIAQIVRITDSRRITDEIRFVGPCASAVHTEVRTVFVEIECSLDRVPVLTRLEAVTLEDLLVDARFDNGYGISLYLGGRYELVNDDIRSRSVRMVVVVDGIEEIVV